MGVRLRLVEHRRGGVVVGRWTWDAAGRRTSFTGPGGEEVRYVYDDAGRPARVEGTAFGTLVYERDGAGRLREVRGEGLSQWWGYDDAGRVTGYRAARPGRAAPEGRPARPGPGLTRGSF